MNVSNNNAHTTQPQLEKQKNFQPPTSMVSSNRTAAKGDPTVGKKKAASSLYSVRPRLLLPDHVHYHNQSYRSFITAYHSACSRIQEEEHEVTEPEENLCEVDLSGPTPETSNDQLAEEKVEGECLAVMSRSLLLNNKNSSLLNTRKRLILLATTSKSSTKQKKKLKESAWQ